MAVWDGSSSSVGSQHPSRKKRPLNQRKLIYIALGCCLCGLALLTAWRNRQAVNEAPLAAATVTATVQSSQQQPNPTAAVQPATVIAPTAIPQTNTLLDFVRGTDGAPLLSEPTVAPITYDLAPADPAIQALAERTLGNRLPTTIRIPNLALETDIIAVGWQRTATSVTWDSPAYATGYLISSAAPGDIGNTVIYGHNNVEGEVFKALDELTIGDEIQIETQDGTVFTYQVSETTIILETGITPSQQAEHLSFFEQTNDERLTLLTCWPYTSNSHRVVVVAQRLS